MQTISKEKKKFKVPHTYVILFTLIIIVSISTYFIPAGEYIRVEDPITGRTVVDPTTYKTIESNPTTIFDFLKAVPNGLVAASSIVFFIFIVGGSFQIVNATGSIEAGIKKIAVKLKNHGKLMVPIILFIFSLGGATIGMAEEAIAFVPIGIALARALGYDAMVGMAIVALGAGCGFSAGFMNPFTVGVAQGIAELPLFSGMWLRVAVWIVVLTATTIYIIRYANKVKSNPSLSYVADLEASEKDNGISLDEEHKMTLSHKIVLLTLVIGFGIIIYGVFKYEWYITEISAIFIGIGLVSGLVSRMGANKIAEEFIIGAKSIAFGALVVGIARGVLVVMQDGLIIDTIVHSLANLIIGLPKALAAVAMMLVQAIINFFIPSGSGQAAVTMPTMAPLADVIGLTRQTAVLAYNFGDGFTNSIIPTSAVLMANLSIAKIPYEKWLKFIAPLMAIWLSIAAIFMVIASLINYV